MSKPKEFTGYPSHLFVEGERMAQLVRVEIGKTIEVEANFQPHCPAQQKVLEAIRSAKSLAVRLELPPAANASYEWDAREITGGVPVTVREVCKLRFRFPAVKKMKPIPHHDVTNCDSSADESGAVRVEVIKRDE